MPLIPVLLGGTTTEGAAWEQCWDDCWVEGVWGQQTPWTECWDASWTDCWGGSGSMVYGVSGVATAIASAGYASETLVSGTSTAVASASLGSSTHTDITAEASLVASALLTLTQTIYVSGEATGGGYVRLGLLGGGWTDCWVSLDVDWAECWENNWIDCWGGGGPWDDCWVAYGGASVVLEVDQQLEVGWTRREYELPESKVNFQYEVESIRRSYIGEG